MALTVLNLKSLFSYFMLIISSYLPVYNTGQEINWVKKWLWTKQGSKYKTNSNKKICDGFQQNSNSKIKEPKYFLNDLIKFMKGIILHGCLWWQVLHPGSSS